MLLSKELVTWSDRLPLMDLWEDEMAADSGITAWAPLLRDLIWPVFTAALLIVARARVAGILAGIQKRIEQGEGFEVPGLKMPGSDPKVRGKPGEEATAPQTGATPQDLATALGGSGVRRTLVAEGAPRDPADEYQQTVYLIHGVGRPKVDDDGAERRTVRVKLDADDDATLDAVTKVVYHLHPTFLDPERVVTDRKKQFPLETRVWGQFGLSADVYFTGYDKPLRLYRYLNF